MLPSVAIELILISQWWRWSAGRLTGGLTRPAFGAITTLSVACGFAFFWFTQSVMDDPLDLYGFVVVQAAGVVFFVPWLLSRGTTLGQSRAFAWATALGPASLGQIFVPYLSPDFRTWQYYLFLAALTSPEGKRSPPDSSPTDRGRPRSLHAADSASRHVSPAGAGERVEHDGRVRGDGEREFSSENGRHRAPQPQGSEHRTRDFVSQRNGGSGQRRLPMGASQRIGWPVISAMRS
jgi:hypothetical protein